MGQQDVRAQICAYIDQPRDLSFLLALFDSSTPIVVAEALVTLLQSRVRNETDAALQFIEDAVTNDRVPAFVRVLPHSGIVAALEANLRADEYGIRNNSLVTISRLGWIDLAHHARILAAAFPRYLARNPLLLPVLLRELFRLASSGDGQVYRDYLGFLDATASSQCYLVRWSLLQFVAQESWRTDARYPGAARLEDVIGRLAADEHPLVRAEAAHWLARIHEHRAASGSSKVERRHARKKVEQRRPPLTFFDLAITFQGVLAAMGATEYDVPTLAAFARFREAHPLRPSNRPVDTQGVARAFAAWRRAAAKPA